MKYIELKKLNFDKKYIVVVKINDYWYSLTVQPDIIDSQQYPIFGYGPNKYITLDNIYHLWKDEDKNGRTYEIAIFDSIDEAEMFAKNENLVKNKSKLK